MREPAHRAQEAEGPETDANLSKGYCFDNVRRVDESQKTGMVPLESHWPPMLPQGNEWHRRALLTLREVPLSSLMLGQDGGPFSHKRMNLYEK